MINKKNGLTVRVGDENEWKDVIEYVYKNNQSSFISDIIEANDRLARQFHDFRSIAPRIREIFSNEIKSKT